jgi:uncharacterized protein
MKKVFIIHGFEGSPNGGWRPWLMRELAKKDIYACALPMPSPEKPICKEWVTEINRILKLNGQDEVVLVGHSLGVPAILRFLEIYKGIKKINKVVLVSGPCQKMSNNAVDRKLNHFIDTPFKYKIIKTKVDEFYVIHGDNDSRVPLEHARILSRELGARLVVIKNGGHLNGSSGHHTLPSALKAII